MAADVSPLVAQVADALADGTAVSWDGIDAAASDEERGLLAELRCIAGIASAHSIELPRELRPGDRWGPLVLEALVGEGSFGSVYRAWDTRLERHVALKLLHHADTQRDSAAIAEGRLLARVRHDHVVLVHGAERLDGRTGIWMEFVEGRTLLDIVSSDGPVDTAAAVDIGVSLCRALTALHDAGVLHRDLKAQNVMRASNGRIVLMDLGAGRDILGETTGDRTGTPLYQAPEVLAGGAASSQTDVYSLGVLLFFVLTGRHPVTGPTLEALRDAHARVARTSLAEARPDAPQPLRAVIERALQPQPGDRYASAADMETDLRRVAAAASTARGTVVRRLSWGLPLVAAATLAGWMTMATPADGVAYRSLAVMPLVNLTDSPEFDEVATGLSERLARHLSRHREVSIAAVGSRDDQDTLTVPAIAARLDVAAFLEGSVRQAGGGLAIDIRLIDVNANRAVWTITQVGSSEELPQIERALLEETARRLQLGRAPPQRAMKADAFSAVLRGRASLNRRTPEGFLRAREQYQLAVEADPEAADAHAGLAEAFLLTGAFVVAPKSEAFARARTAAERALALDATSPQAHAVIGYIEIDSGNFDAGQRALLAALAIDPGYATARQWYALTLAGEPDPEAAKQMELALAADPLSRSINSDLGAVYRSLGRFDEAVSHLARTTTLFPEFAEGHRQHALALEATGQHREAADAMRRAIDLGHEIPENLAVWGANLAVAGDAAGARRALDALRELRQRQPVPLMYDATIYSALGDLDRSVRTLLAAERETDHGLQTMVSQALQKPTLHSLWRHPSFVALAQRVAPEYVKAATNLGLLP